MHGPSDTPSTAWAVPTQSSATALQTQGPPLSLHVPVPYPHQPMATTSPPAHPVGSSRDVGTLSCPALIPHPWNRAWHHRCMMTASGADNSDSPESAGVHVCCKRALKAWFVLALRVARFLEATCPTFNKQGTKELCPGGRFLPELPSASLEQSSPAVT